MNNSFEPRLSNETLWNNNTATPLISQQPPTQDTLACVVVISGLMIAACCFIMAIIAAVRSEHDESSDRVIDSSTSDHNFQERLERVKRCLVVRYWTTESKTSTDSAQHKGDIARHVNAAAAAVTAADDSTTDVDLEQQLEEELRHDTSTTTTCTSSDDDDLESVSHGTLCAICLNQFQDHEVVCESKNTACCHVFHLTCMSLWLRKHSSCPVCREEYLCTTGSNRRPPNNRNQQEIAIWEVNGSTGNSNFGLF